MLDWVQSLTRDIWNNTHLNKWDTNYTKHIYGLYGIYYNFHSFNFSNIVIPNPA
jgi:hypothetical protein